MSPSKVWGWAADLVGGLGSWLPTQAHTAVVVCAHVCCTCIFLQAEKGRCLQREGRLSHIFCYEELSHLTSASLLALFLISNH